MRESRRRQIRDIAESLLRDAGSITVPVDVEALALSLGVRVERTPTDDDLSGFLYRDPVKDKTVVGVNASHHPNRQRFTIAHEIGHLLLHVKSGVHVDPTSSGPQIVFRDGVSSEGTDVSEIEANVFASELLMPIGPLRRDLEKIGMLDLHDDDALDAVFADLAQRYGVSKQAVTIRVARLGYARA